MVKPDEYNNIQQTRNAYFYFYSKNMINTIIFNEPDLSVFMFMTIIYPLKSSVWTEPPSKQNYQIFFFVAKEISM